MKYFWLPVSILALLLALSLWNAHTVGREIEGWCKSVEEARAAARGGDLAAAEKSMRSLDGDWQRRRAYYHSMLEHDELDEAEGLFARAMSALAEGENGDFLTETAALTAQLRVVAEMQSLRLENVF